MTCFHVRLHVDSYELLIFESLDELAVAWDDEDWITDSSFDEAGLDALVAAMSASGVVLSTRTTVYTYDFARRLVREVQTTETGTTTTNYTFDNRNNRATMVVTGDESSTTTYAYDLNNRLLSKTRTEQGQAARTTTFTYDRNGNQLTQTTNGHTQTHTYDAFNRLVSVTRPATATEPAMTATYAYRTGVLRHSKTVNGVTTTHVWDRGNIILERNASGAVVNRFHRGRGHLIRSDHHGFYVFNVRGDVVQRTDANGNVIHSYRFDAFGNQLSQDTVNTNPFRFAGEYYDWETGFIYLRARFYNPMTGRFISEDPYWGIHNMRSSPNNRMQAGNLFAFTMNNPVMWNDPSGLFVFRAIGNAISSAARNVSAASQVAGVRSGALTASAGSSSVQSSSSSSASGANANRGVMVTDWDRAFLPRNDLPTLQGLANIWNSPSSIQAQRDNAFEASRMLRAPHLFPNETQLASGHILQTNSSMLVASSSVFRPSTTISYQRLFADTGTWTRLTNVSGRVFLPSGYRAQIYATFGQTEFGQRQFYESFRINASSFSHDINAPWVFDTGADVTTRVGTMVSFDIRGGGNSHYVEIVNRIHDVGYTNNGMIAPQQDLSGSFVDVMTGRPRDIPQFRPGRR